MAIGMFLVYLVPPSLLFLSLSRVVVELGLQDKIWALVVVYPTITTPVSVWLLMGFLKGIPVDIEEQAMVDGYSRLGVRAHGDPAGATRHHRRRRVCVHAHRQRVHLRARLHLTQLTEGVSTGVPTELVRGDVFFWQSLEAATLLVAVPIAVVFTMFLDRFVAGFTMGAVKG